MGSPGDLFLPKTLISGGQTGVDRAALDFAMERGLEHGGWCPAGRLAEDGPISTNYQLTETGTSDYAVRTEQNVLDSDATLVLFHSSISGGTKLTTSFAKRHSRPILTADLAAIDLNDEIDRCKLWLNDIRPNRLNIAGPRESNAPGIYDQTLAFLRRLITNET